MKEKWLRSTLGDICTKITDGSHWSPKSIAQGIPMASVKDMADYGFNIESCKKISDEDYQELIKNDCKPLIDDVLIAKDGSYLKHVFVWRNDIDIAILSSIAILRPNKEIVKPNFLAKYLTSPIIKKAMSGYVTGAALPRIILKDFIKFRVLLPPLHIQRKIASILSVYDDLTENNSRRIKILEEMAHAIYQEWFVKFRFPGHEKVRMVNSPLGKIPEGWEVKGIIDVEYFDFIKENVKQFDGEKEYFATANIEGIEIIKEGLMYSYKDKPSRAQKQPIIYSVWFARMKDTYKVLGFTETNKNIANCVILSSGFAGFRSEKLVFPFLYYSINSEYFHKEKDRFATGATQVSLNNEGLSKIKTIVPNRKLIELFGGRVLSIIDQIFLLQQKNQNLRKTHDLLLPRLISGEIDVEDLDIDIGELAE